MSTAKQKLSLFFIGLVVLSIGTLVVLNLCYFDLCTKKDPEDELFVNYRGKSIFINWKSKIVEFDNLSFSLTDCSNRNWNCLDSEIVSIITPRFCHPLAWEKTGPDWTFNGVSAAYLHAYFKGDRPNGAFHAKGQGVSFFDYRLGRVEALYVDLKNMNKYSVAIIKRSISDELLAEIRFEREQVYSKFDCI